MNLTLALCIVAMMGIILLFVNKSNSKKVQWTLGIVMETPDNRVNVPEIYLHGFGLKRKGGIRRPK